MSWMVAFALGTLTKRATNEAAPIKTRPVRPPPHHVNSFPRPCYDLKYLISPTVATVFLPCPFQVVHSLRRSRLSPFVPFASPLALFCFSKVVPTLGICNFPALFVAPDHNTDRFESTGSSLLTSSQARFLPTQAAFPELCSPPKIVGRSYRLLIRK